MATNFGWESELPALAALSDQAAADAIAAMTKTEIVPIPSHTWLGWLGGDSRFLRLQQLAANENAESTARNIAIVACKLCDSPEATLRLDDPGHQAMLAAVAAAVQATPEEIAEIQALGTRVGPKYPGPIYSGQIAEARRAMA